VARVGRRMELRRVEMVWGGIEGEGFWRIWRDFSSRVRRASRERDCDV
jgi:hypothetical protein